MERQGYSDIRARKDDRRWAFVCRHHQLPQQRDAVQTNGAKLEATLGCEKNRLSNEHFSAKNFEEIRIALAALVLGACLLHSVRPRPISCFAFESCTCAAFVFASWSINPQGCGGRGLSPKEVQADLGHSSIVITLDTYGHLFLRGHDHSGLAAAASALLGRQEIAWRPRLPGLARLLGILQAGMNTWARTQEVHTHSPVVDIRTAAGARLGVRIPQAAHIREAAAGNRPPHWANICGHMDRDGNPADKDTARMRRMRSAPARREARRRRCKCARTFKNPRADRTAPKYENKKAHLTSG